MNVETIDLGTKVRYADYGGEGPAIVLLHGLGGLHLNWMRVAPALTKHGHVLAPDLPGFGGSEPWGRAGMEGIFEGATRFIDAKTKGKITLVGNSLGGALAIMIAARAPQRIERMILVSPAVPQSIRSGVDPTAATTMGFAMLPYVGPASVQRQSHRIGPERAVRDAFDFMVHDRERLPRDVLDAHVAEAKERMQLDWVGSSFSGALRSLFWMMVRRGNYAKMIRSIRVPTLVLAGARDRMIRIGATRRAVALNPSFQLEVWDDVGHIAQLEVPDRVLDRIERFWRATPPAPTL